MEVFNGEELLVFNPEEEDDDDDEDDGDMKSFDIIKERTYNTSVNQSEYDSPPLNDDDDGGRQRNLVGLLNYTRK